MPSMMAAIISITSSSSSFTLPPGFDAPQLVQHGGKLVAQRFVNSRIALYHHVLASQAAGDVVLLRQPGKLDEGFNLRVFLRGYPEGNGLVAPAVVVVSIFQRHFQLPLSTFNLSAISFCTVGNRCAYR